MKPTTYISKQPNRRAYEARMAEREFVRAVMARKMTPEVEQRLAAGARQAQAAMSAPFLAKFRRTEVAIEA